MAYQKVTTTSYGGRLKNALSGVGMGFVMLIAGTVLLFWNEGRTVKTTKMLKEAQGVCVELGDIEQVNADMNGKMIHASGLAATEEVLTDGMFDISLNAIKLIRSTEYYQWVEHQKSETRDKVGGGQETITTYTYSKEWVSSPVSSSSFEDPQYRGINNDVLLKVEPQTWQAQNVSFGAYTFPEGLISQMNNSEPLTVELKPEVTEFFEKEFHRVYDVSASDSFVHPNGNVLYLGLNPNNPKVGDVRVTYKKVLPGEVSILAKVNGNTFEKFTAKNGYSMMTIGFLLIFFGFKNIFNIITQLLKVLPFLANIADLGINLVAGVLAIVWTLVVIAVAWLFYRPVLGIILLVIAGALIWFLGKKSKEKKAQLDAQAAAAPAAPAAAPVQPAAPVQQAPPAAAPVPPAAPALEYPEPPAPDFSDAPAPPPEFPDAPVE